MQKRTKQDKNKQRHVEQLAIVQQPVAQIAGLPKDYPQFLSKIKDEIGKARIRASLSANSEMMLLYWRIGKGILSRQNNEGWGAKVIDRLAADLKNAFPDMKGFSLRNIKYINGVSI